MPETYNVQERSFIKKPEPKICVTCGQPIAPDVKPMNNEMNYYLNPISSRVVTINSNENIIEIQGIPLYKVTGKDANGQHTSKHIPPAKKPEPQAETPPPKPIAPSTKPAVTTTQPK
jgi:hypothetical protein